MRRNPGSTKERREQRAALQEYRKIHAALAIHRDGGFCVHCYWFLGHIKEYEHVHHVRGRGSVAGDAKEKYTSLLCLCQSCHDVLGSWRVEDKERNDYQKELLLLVNDYPINKRFKHSRAEDERQKIRISC